jgi:signal transduction histidine kinase
MAEEGAGESARNLIGELTKLPVFADLAEDQLAWLADRLEDVRLAPGDVYAREGDPPEHLFIVLQGELRIHRGSATDTPIFTVSAGHISGLLPFSRLTHYPGTGRAMQPSRILRLHKQYFPEMLHRMPLLGQRLVGIMSDRIRETTRIETQRDKLMALGKLSAGLAHELNNPAAAARRAANSLLEALENVRDASLRLLQYPLSSGQRESIARFEREAGQYVSVTPSDPLARADREERLTQWFEARQLEESWKIAPVLAEYGVEAERLDALAAEVGDAVVGPALMRIVSILVIFGLVREIETSTRRISDLVAAIKRYSYMDQAPVQEIDLHQGLESTLTIFSHRLKEGVTVVREYDAALPRVCAYGGELNQVWTNLIDNALDAMDAHGQLRVRTAREPGGVLVEIGDNGPGIPPAVQSRIFEPFFTTKGVGEGTGLGLDTVCRIVQQHHGSIRVESKPGDTRFQVRLPITQPRTA